WDQVFTALRQAIQFAFGGDLSNHLFATLPVPTADLTGPNTGIGFAAAVHLARLGPAHLLLAVRDLKRMCASRLQVNALSTGLLGLLLLPLLHATASRPDASPHLTLTGSAGKQLSFPPFH
ncbi:hypothetical protein B0H14DRAFT_2841929, partial [Mycena olivaceomarginata]